MSLETMVTWYLNIACKSRLGTEDLTRNSSELVSGLSLPPQQIRRYAITNNKTKDQSVK